MNGPGAMGAKMGAKMGARDVAQDLAVGEPPGAIAVETRPIGGESALSRSGL